MSGTFLHYIYRESTLLLMVIFIFPKNNILSTFFYNDINLTNYSFASIAFSFQLHFRQYEVWQQCVCSSKTLIQYWHSLNWDQIEIANRVGSPTPHPNYLYFPIIIYFPSNLLVEFFSWFLLFNILHQFVVIPMYSRAAL